MEEAVREYRYTARIYGQAYQCPSEALRTRRRRLLRFFVYPSQVGITKDNEKRTLGNSFVWEVQDTTENYFLGSRFGLCLFRIFCCT